ncbi:nitrilase-related carbon-nitrogen hydrolase [Mucilaginibacter sp. CSA2-8R]|uniref:nitrilase-related carbon-nitrogen hydrolase n=1 Tax=Mucilaginibacter sp. CSA2-8R TaxID=3141542 RepID=UPI00315D099F
MKIALASPPIPKNISEGLKTFKAMVAEAAGRHAEIICFPESYLQGDLGIGYPEADRTVESLEVALNEICRIALEYKIAIIISMDGYLDSKLVNLANVISAEGKLLGYQTQN